MPPFLQQNNPNSLNPQDSLMSNVQKLVTRPVLSRARQKAILTISKRRNISRQDALFVNSLAIGKRIKKYK
jgi:acetamidase/formamidase